MYHQNTLPHRKTLRENVYVRKSKCRNAAKTGTRRKGQYAPPTNLMKASKIDCEFASIVSFFIP